MLRQFGRSFGLLAALGPRHMELEWKRGETNWEFLRPRHKVALGLDAAYRRFWKKKRAGSDPTDPQISIPFCRPKRLYHVQSSVRISPPHRENHISQQNIFFFLMNVEIMSCCNNLLGPRLCHASFICRQRCLFFSTCSLSHFSHRASQPQP